jgi:hypothetical protein
VTLGSYPLKDAHDAGHRRVHVLAGSALEHRDHVGHGRTCRAKPRHEADDLRVLAPGSAQACRVADDEVLAATEHEHAQHEYPMRHAAAAIPVPHDDSLGRPTLAGTAFTAP